MTAILQNCRCGGGEDHGSRSLRTVVRLDGGPGSPLERGNVVDNTQQRKALVSVVCGHESLISPEQEGQERARAVLPRTDSQEKNNQGPNGRIPNIPSILT